ncbi:MAG: hypothetical protein AAGG06_14225 [Pseudomonadota bacterium]
MPMHIDGETAVLSGSCPADEAQDLTDWLRDEGGKRVVLDAVTHLHTAVLQTLLAFDIAIDLQGTEGVAAEALTVARPAKQPNS